MRDLVGAYSLWETSHTAYAFSLNHRTHPTLQGDHGLPRRFPIYRGKLNMLTSKQVDRWVFLLGSASTLEQAWTFMMLRSTFQQNTILVCDEAMQNLFKKRYPTRVHETGSQTLVPVLKRKHPLEKACAYLYFLTLRFTIFNFPPSTAAWLSCTINVLQGLILWIQRYCIFMQLLHWRPIYNKVIPSPVDRVIGVLCCKDG